MMTNPNRRSDDLRPVPFPVLMADIGGTNVRFGLLVEAHSPVRHFPTVQITDFPDFATAAAETVLNATAVMPETLLLAIAAHVAALRTKLTAASRTMEPAALKEEMNLTSVITVNDFEALAMALPALHSDQVIPIGEAEPRDREPRVVLGAGTGLGVGSIVWAGRRAVPIAGEGGHVGFGPATARDFEIWPHLERLHGRVSGETLLSGNGLVRLYRAVCAVNGAAGGNSAEGSDVTSAAEAGDPQADEKLDLFVEYLGRRAGDFALLLLARGGIYIGGVIAPRIPERLSSPRFRAAFEGRAPHRAILEKIPTFLITEPRPAFTGLAAFAVLPERYAVDLSARRIGV